MSRRRDLLPCLLSIALAAGCVNSSRLKIAQTEVGEVPDDEKAYLVIDASVLPGDRPQPTWIRLFGYVHDAYLSTSRDIFELPPGVRRVTFVDFRDSPGTGHRAVALRQTQDMFLKPGTIYYYGRLEIAGDRRQRRVRTVFDPDLFRRACKQAPQHFRRFGMVLVGPLADSGVDLPKCAESPGYF